MSRIVFSLLLFAFSSPIAMSQFNYERYQPARLDTISFLPVHLISDTCHFIVLDTDMPLKCNVYFADSIRAIDSMSFVVIEDWCHEVLKNPSAAKMFEQELLVYQGNTPLWIPVQKQLVPYFKKEIAKGDLLWIYVSVVGATKERIVFTLNEFDKTE